MLMLQTESSQVDSYSGQSRISFLRKAQTASSGIVEMLAMFLWVWGVKKWVYMKIQFAVCKFIHSIVSQWMLNEWTTEVIWWIKCGFFCFASSFKIFVKLWKWIPLKKNNNHEMQFTGWSKCASEIVEQIMNATGVWFQSIKFKPNHNRQILTAVLKCQLFSDSAKPLKTFKL